MNRFQKIVAVETRYISKDCRFDIFRGMRKYMRKEFKMYSIDVLCKNAKAWRDLPF